MLARTALICSLSEADLAPSAFAQPEVPSFREVTGHSFGERITSHRQMHTYLERLAATSPRVRPSRQGERSEGAIFRLTLDADYWLRAGYSSDELPILVESSRIYLEPDGPPNANRRVMGRYAPKDALLSGHAWEESKERLPGKVAVYEERESAP